MKAAGRGGGRNLPLLATAVLLIAFFLAASVLYHGFFSWRVATSLLSDNAFLGITAVGTTLVIFSGGIDLSIGAVLGFTSIFVATLIETHRVPSAAAWLVALALGGAFGAAQGVLIQVFSLPSFLVTLAGMFLARGAGYWISTDSIGIHGPLYERLSNFMVSVGGARFPVPALVLLVVMLGGYVLAHHTRFGRALLAMGGNEQSALLMGLPVGAAKIAVYTLNGLGAALAGVVATLYTGSGNPNMGVGLELDAIAVVVMGGTLLTGGRGHVGGTFLGVLIYGTLQAAILFDGRLSPWWSRIVVGLLLLAFILMQRYLIRKLPGSSH